MSVPSEKYGRVTRLTFCKVDDEDPNHPASAGPKANGVPALRVEFEYDGGVYTFDALNGEWSLGNPALQLLAYLELQPTDWDKDSQTLELDNFGKRRVPIVRQGRDDYALAATAFENGSRALEYAPWFDGQSDSEDDESDDSARYSGGGGGGNDGGGRPTRETVETNETDLPDGVGIENEVEERGMTVSVE